MNEYLGKKYGKLTIMGIGENKKYPSGQTKTTFDCVCDCGKEHNVVKQKILNGESKSCGCSWKTFIPHNKKEFNYLDNVGIGFLYLNEFGYIKRKRYIKVKCIHCNSEKETTLYVAERSKSCGCLQVSKKDKHTANRVRINSINRRGRKKKVDDGTIDKCFIEELLYLYNNICPVCLTDITNNYHLDHIIPLIKGGIHSRYNIQPLCATCNLQKNKL